MDEQLTFEFEQRPTIKGFPELRWTGKRPYRSTQYYPAQLRETYGTEKNGWINKIFWGDNLQVMSHLLKEYRGKIDLIYIDPPFASDADYKRKIKVRNQAVVTDSLSFEEKQYGDIWNNDEYLQFMYERLLIMRELLSINGTIFVHCDWRVCSYIRLLMDEVFGKENFLNEIIWNYSGGRIGHNFFGRKHDNIYWYAKKYGNQTFNYDAVRQEYAASTLARNRYKNNGSSERVLDYKPNEEGKFPEDVWTISIINPFAKERLDYPTQKPERLIEDIIKSASNPGDLVFDCFMGSGTTQAVAMKLGRRFIGADINLGAIQTTTKRLLSVAKELQSVHKPVTYEIPQPQLSMVAEAPASYHATANAGIDDKMNTENCNKVIDFSKSKSMDTSAMDEDVKYTGFEVYNVNNYDFFRNPVEAHDLLIAALEIQPFPQSDVWDGELDGRMVKNVWDDTTLMDNQRFKKLCRLPQLGVYVDEAHHLFGADLEKQIRSGGANKTSLRDTINLLAENTSIVACYNYTGTPYVKNQLLPEVVYAYGLRESIWNGFLKDADPLGFENVKSNEFLTAAVTTFWERYGNQAYEGLNPKLAIYAAGVEEAATEVKPALEKILAKLGIPTSKILLNVGDAKYTKNDDIRDFNNLDVPGTEGNEKQFIILVEKGKEGWNCRSLFGVALFRSPKSKIFVLQATMRCLRAITDKRLTATVFLSKENYDTLDDELHKNFNMEIKDIKNAANAKHRKYQVRVLPPPRTITLKRVWHEYTLHEKEYSAPVDFRLVDADLSRYASVMYERDSLAQDTTVKEKNIDHLQENMKYSEFSLTGEVARYLNISCILTARILRESVDGLSVILDAVNCYNAILDDYIIPTVFHALFEITSELKTEDRELVLLHEPKDAGYYEFSAKEDLVLINRYPGFTPEQIKKSFHADTYCFDSIPEKACFMQYITSGKVKEVYFTGMFTSNQGDLSVHYYDPESGRIRQYYPDFLAKMTDGSYRLIEVKGDNKIDDIVVKAKQAAAEEMAVASGIHYLMYAGSRIINSHILDDEPMAYS